MNYNKKFWDVQPAWAVTDENGNIFYTDKEACIYESYNVAQKEKGSYQVRAVEIFIRKPTKSKP